MASVVEEVMTHATKVEPKKSVVLELSTMPAVEQHRPHSAECHVTFVARDSGSTRIVEVISLFYQPQPGPGL